MSQPQSTSSRRLRWLIVLLILAVVVILGIQFLPDIALRALGFTPQENGNIIEATPESTPKDFESILINNPTTPEQLHIYAEGEMDVVLLSAESSATAIDFGTDSDGNPIGRIEYQETDTEELCRIVFKGCRSDQFTIAGIDFQPNGLLLDAQIQVSILQQEVGAMLTLMNEPLGFDAMGIILAGVSYSIPEDGPIRGLLDEFTARGDAILADMRFDVDETLYCLSEIRIADETLELIVRGCSE